MLRYERRDSDVCCQVGGAWRGKVGEAWLKVWPDDVLEGLIAENPFLSGTHAHAHAHALSLLAGPESVQRPWREHEHGHGHGYGYR